MHVHLEMPVAEHAAIVVSADGPGGAAGSELQSDRHHFAQNLGVVKGNPRHEWPPPPKHDQILRSALVGNGPHTSRSWLTPTARARGIPTGRPGLG